MGSWETRHRDVYESWKKIIFEAKFEQQSNMVNRSTQTANAMADMSIQAGKEDEKDEERGWGPAGSTPKRANKSYIYNIDD